MNTQRITVTALHDAAASLYEEEWSKPFFRAIAHLPLGYGSEGCDDTEVDYFKTIAFLIEAVKEEKSHVLILGTCPRSITSSWIRASELVIKGSEVKVVVIPMANLLDKKDNPTVDGSILFVDKTGVFRIEHLGTMLARDFVQKFCHEARLIDGSFDK